MRWPVDLCTLLLVTSKANLILSNLVAHLVFLAVNLVARITSTFATSMLTALPLHPLATLVASKTGAVTSLGSGCGVLAEAAVHLRRFVTALVRYMLFALAVAIDAGRRALVCGSTVFSLAYGKDSRVQLEHC